MSAQSSIFFLLPLALACGAAANTARADDSPEMLRMLPDAGSGAYRLVWQGQAGRTYFVQMSEDLAHWRYCPVIESGVGTKVYVFSTTAKRCFARLQIADRTADDPYGADFDGDGVSNWVEIQQGMNPMVPDLDTDGDGMPDAWEIAHGLNPNNPADANDDSDGDGVKARDEFTFGLDPRVADAGAFAPTGGRSVFAYTANDELSVYTPAVGSPASYSPDAEGNLHP